MACVLQHSHDPGADVARGAGNRDSHGSSLARSSRHGVLRASTGPRGGFELARPAEEVSLLDVVEAVDGAVSRTSAGRSADAGAAPYLPRSARACILAVKMAEAHAAWRQSLASVSLADIVASLRDYAPARTRERMRRGS
ncbi:RrF2 family transcriptional regulator [Blastococcus sp. SYSU DS0510]